MPEDGGSSPPCNQLNCGSSTVEQCLGRQQSSSMLGARCRVRFPPAVSISLRIRKDHNLREEITRLEPGTKYIDLSRIDDAGGRGRIGHPVPIAALFGKEDKKNATFAVATDTAHKKFGRSYPVYTR